MFYFCPKTIGFYIKGMHAIPRGSVSISDTEYRDIMEGHRNGKAINADINGRPILVEYQYEKNIK